MNTIGNNQGVQTTGPGVQVQEQNDRLKPTVGRPGGPEASATAKDSLEKAGVQPSVPRPRDGQQYLDPEKMSEFIAKVAEAIRKASVEPHVVGYKPDPASTSYFIEIRRVDGTLVTSFAPEKVLNLHGNPDDLSGMVIDQKT